MTTLAQKAWRAVRGGGVLAFLTFASASLVVGLFNAAPRDLLLVGVASGLWVCIDFALALGERTHRDHVTNIRVRARVTLAGLCLAVGAAAAMGWTLHGWSAEVFLTCALAFGAFTAGMLALKLWERKNPLEVDWRTELTPKAPALGFLQRPKRRILLIGTSMETRMVAGAIAVACNNLRLVGALRLPGDEEYRPVAGAPVLGVAEDIEDVLAKLRIHGQQVDALVYPALSDDKLPAAVDAVLSEIKPGQAPLALLRDLAELKAYSAGDGLDDMAWRSRRRVRRLLLKVSRQWPSQSSAFFKRALDIAVSGALLVLAAPALVLAVIGVRLTMGAPVHFWQERPGRFGRPFRVYKLRSMRNASKAEGQRTADKARTTRLGAFLRRTRIDEVPQFVSVLRGEMSLVGPRPLLFEDMTDLADARLLVRPGISGWAQVNGGHALTPEEKLALDVWYSKRANIWLDLWILLRSVRVVLTGDVRKPDAIAEAEAEFAALKRAIEAAASGEWEDRPTEQRPNADTTSPVSARLAPAE